MLITELELNAQQQHSQHPSTSAHPLQTRGITRSRCRRRRLTKALTALEEEHMDGDDDGDGDAVDNGI
ncbi:hypothetical protein ACLKA6_010830 [Drosophila palustris]